MIFRHLPLLGRLLCTLMVLISSPLAGAGAVFCSEAGQILLESGTLDGNCNTCPEHEPVKHEQRTNPDSCCTDLGFAGAQTVASRVSYDSAAVVLPVVLHDDRSLLNTARHIELSSKPDFPNPVILSNDLAITRSVVLLI